MISWTSKFAEDIPNWRRLADGGDRWAVDRLLGQPILDEEADHYYRLFTQLDRERGKDIYPLGMAGNMALPRSLPRTLLEAAADRLHYEGEAREDFIDIMILIDDKCVEIESKKAIAEVNKTTAKMKRR